MPSSDPYLRPGLTPPTDVELYESAAAGGTTTPVAVVATALGTAAVSATFIPAVVPLPVPPFPYHYPRPKRRVVTIRVAVHATAHAEATVATQATHRRRFATVVRTSVIVYLDDSATAAAIEREDEEILELILAGAL